MTRKKKWLVGILICLICLILGLFQSEWVRVIFSQKFFPVQSIDFPLGEKKKISYSFSNFLEKPYMVILRAEQHASSTLFHKQGEGHDIPLDIFVQCVEITNQGESLMFSRRYRGTELTVSRSGGGFHDLILFGDDLQTGKYRCDIEDNTPESGKGLLAGSDIWIGPVFLFF